MVMGCLYGTPVGESRSTHTHTPPSTKALGVHLFCLLLRLSLDEVGLDEIVHGEGDGVLAQLRSLQEARDRRQVPAEEERDVRSPERARAAGRISTS
jgi:hypothetical protein